MRDHETTSSFNLAEGQQQHAREGERTSSSSCSSRQELEAVAYNSSSLDQQFEEFLQQEADNAAFAAYHYHDPEDEQQQPNIDDVIEADNQTVVSELTTFTSASLFRGPLYQRPTTVMLDDIPNDQEIADLFRSNGNRGNSSCSRPTASRTTTTSSNNNSNNSPNSSNPAAAGAGSPSPRPPLPTKTKKDSTMNKSQLEEDPQFHAKKTPGNTILRSLKEIHEEEEEEENDDYDDVLDFDDINPKNNNKKGNPYSNKKQGGGKIGGEGNNHNNNHTTTTATTSRQRQSSPSLPVHSSSLSSSRASLSSSALRYDNRGRILKSSFLSLSSSIRRPGAYLGAAGQSNDGDAYGEAMQVPDYSSTLGLTSSRQEEDPIHLRATARASATASGRSRSRIKTKVSTMASEDFEEEELNGTIWCCNNNHRRGGRLCIAAAAIALLLIVALSIVLPIVVLPQKDKNSTKEAAATEVSPTSSLDQQQQQQQQQEEYVVPNLTQATIQIIQDDKFSPQFQAYDWVSRDPNWDTYQGWRKRQRFALACIYYSIVPLGLHTFQKPIVPSYYTNECSWIKIGGKSYCNNHGNSNATVGDGVGEIILFTMKGQGEAFDMIANAHVPPQIGYLTKLERFVLNNFPLKTSLEEFLPTETLQAFPSNCQHLSFRSSNLVGSIPSTLGLLTSLTSLSLQSTTTSQNNMVVTEANYVASRNRLTSTIPTQLGLLINLKHLYLSGNLLSGSIPTQLGKHQLPNLVDFQIQDNPNLDPPILPNSFCDDDDDGIGIANGNGNSSSSSVAAPMESLTTDWCNTVEDCCTK